MKQFKSERGQSLVELAVSLVILLYLLSGAVELGITFFQYVQLRDAAQEGALYGSTQQSKTEADIIARVQAASSSPINLADPSVTIAVTAADPAGTAKAVTAACESDGLTVTVSYDHRIFMPFMPQILGRQTIHLAASVTDTVLVPLCPGP
jgi:Flp pilus assembly protein TadG